MICLAASEVFVESLLQRRLTDAEREAFRSHIRLALADRAKRICRDAPRQASLFSEPRRP